MSPDLVFLGAAAGEFGAWLHRALVVVLALAALVAAARFLFDGDDRGRR